MAAKVVEITIRTETWANEISWNIDGDLSMSGGSVEHSTTGPYDNHKDYSKVYSLSPGMHTLNFFDEFGDGWNDGASATITSNGHTILDTTLFTNGVTMSAEFDVGNTDPIEVTLPSCLSDCAGEPSPNDGPLNEAKMCKFISGLNLNLADDDASCLSDCTAEDDIEGMFNQCHELQLVYEELPNMEAAATNTYMSFLENGDSSEVEEFVYDMIGGTSFSSFSSFAPLEGSAAVQDGSYTAGGAAEEPETFDDDWFLDEFSGGSYTLLMAAQTQQQSKVSSKRPESGFLAAAGGAAACVAAALVVVSIAVVPPVEHNTKNERPQLVACAQKSRLVYDGPDVLARALRYDAALAQRAAS